MVLRHHPDKRRGAGEEVRDGDDYFTNITKAYETLGDALKRRAFDSVDPEFDDKVPSDKMTNKDKFYDVGVGYLGAVVLAAWGDGVGYLGAMVLAP